MGIGEKGRSGSHHRGVRHGGRGTVRTSRSESVGAARPFAPILPTGRSVVCAVTHAYDHARLQELAFEARRQHLRLQKEAMLKSRRGGVTRESADATRALEAMEKTVSMLFFPTILGLMNFVWATFHGEFGLGGGKLAAIASFVRSPLVSSTLLTHCDAHACRVRSFERCCPSGPHHTTLG
jgi:hypothetical protein